MRSLVWLSIVALAVAPALADAAGSEQLVVPAVQVSGVPETASPVLTELILEALLSRHGLHALGPSDLKDLLTIEQQRQLVGCDASQCMTGLAGALGASRLVTGMAGKLGDTFVLSVRVVDATSAQVLGRASRKFARLEDAPDVVGPLVDELLGRAPRAAIEAPKLLAARKEAEVKQKAASVEAFCSAVLDRHQSAVLAAESAPRLVTERRRVLEDLLWTPFVTELESKLACWRARDADVEARLLSARLGARSNDEAERTAIALAEWSEARENARLLVEAYRTGLEKEKLGTGARPVELPFALRPAHAPARDSSAELAKLVSAWDAATPVITAALAAVERGDKAAFVERFTLKGPAKRESPRDLYVDTLSRAERATLDVAPWFVLDRAELLRRARVLAEKGRVVAAVRARDVKAGTVTLFDVELVKEGSTWKLDDWPTRK